jgi:hypothetical protein
MLHVQVNKAFNIFLDFQNHQILITQLKIGTLISSSTTG